MSLSTAMRSIALLVTLSVSALFAQIPSTWDPPKKAKPVKAKVVKTARPSR